MKFTTIYKDNDLWTRNCANPTDHDGISGGWWYNHCTAITISTNTKTEYISIVGIIHYHLLMR